jgi:hypothetical protein
MNKMMQIALIHAPLSQGLKLNNLQICKVAKET